MDENPKTIPTGFAPLDFLVAMVMPSIAESILESWDAPVFELVEKAKDKGIEGIYDFLQSSGGKEKRYDFNTMDINQYMLNQLLMGKFKTFEELTNAQENLKITMDRYDYESSLVYTLFYYKKIDEAKEEELLIIDTIFFN